MSDESVHASDSLGVGLIIDNKSFFSSLNLKCHLTFLNNYYNEKCDQLLSVAVVSKSKNINPILCETKNCGIIEILLNKSELSDLLGMFICEYNSSEKVTIEIFPETVELSDMDRLGLLGGFCDNEDDTKTGNEYSDTSNIREYIPGDRIKDIHWKLSSKRDILLVKEHIKTCENQLIVWVDRSKRKKNNELILKLTSSIAKYCITEGVLLKLLWLSKDNQTVSDATIVCEADFKKAYNELFMNSSYENIEDIRQLLMYYNMKMSSVIRVGFKDTGVEIYTYEI